MSYSSTDARIINNINHVIKYKIELLDKYFSAISEITTDASNVTFNIDANSDIRRTSTMTLLVEDEEWLTENFEIGWLDKVVRFSIGLKYAGDREQSYVDIALTDDAQIDAGGVNWKWYVMGTLLLTSDTFNYDETTKELEISLVDLMACSTEERGNPIGVPYKYPANNNIRNALIATVSHYLPFAETDVAEFPDVIPYDLDFTGGTYPYNITSTIVGLFPWYEQYYDANGTYHADQIPMRMDEDCLLYKEDIDDLIIAEHRSFNFSAVKNTTEIYGKLISAHYTASNCTLSGDTYTLGFLLPMTTLEPTKKYEFKPQADSPASPKIHIALTNAEPGEQDTAPLYNSDGTALPAGAMVAGRTYVVRCMLEETSDGNGGTTLTKSFYLLGQKQIHVIVREMNVQPSASVIAADKLRNDCEDIKYIINPDSPYACDRFYRSAGTNARLSIETGEMRQVLYDGDYASIYSTELAYQRGEYENYLKCRFNTDVELETLLIPFIDVNQKIEYTSPISGEVHQYIVKTVIMDVSRFTMRMQLARFYDYYPFDTTS